MSIVSPSELALLRERPHSTKLWLSIYKPSTVLSARVNDASIAVGEYQITYDNGVGTWGNIRSGMTMLVGTAAGKADKGRIRVRSATASVITVAENSHINWADDDYLTVLAFYEIWPVYARYTLSGDTVTWYKDYDVAYTNQNGVGLGTIINMGSHWAGFTGTAVYYSADGSVNVRSDGITYAWIFEGGSPASSAVEIPGNVTYATPGHYTTRLTITSTGGIQDVSYRHISIYDRPGQGSNVPILQWEMDTISGNRDEGGHSVSIRIHEDVDDIIDGSLVVIFADDIYGSTEQSIGGNAAGRQKIVFVGYIRDGSVQHDYQRSQVEFEIVSPPEIMKAKEGTNISVDSVASPADWFEVQDLDVRKALYHYFRWHSTVLFCCDLRYNYTNYKFQYFDTDPSSVYDGINTFLKKSLIGRLSSDRQGRLYAEIDPAGINDAISTLAAGIELTRQDWINEPEITEIISPPLAYLEMGGVAWSGASTGTSDAFLSAAPGTVAAYFGGSEDHQGLILTSQDHLNTIAGDVFAWKNAKYPSCTFEVSGNYRNFDIAPLERTLITLNATDTHRGIVWASKSFIIHDMEWSYNPERQLLLPTIELHEVTAGYAGTTVDIPETPMENFPDQPPFTPPPFDLVPPPFVNPIPPPIVPQPPPDDEIPPGSSDIDCLTDVNAAANGPYGLHMNGILESNQFGGDDLWVDVRTWASWIRSNAHTYKTELHVTACWEESTDGGVTWSAMTNMSKVHAYALGPAGNPGQPPEGAVLEEGTWGAASEQCETRIATFDSLQQVFSWQLKLDQNIVFESQCTTGTSNTFWWEDLSGMPKSYSPGSSSGPAIPYEASSGTANVVINFASAATPGNRVGAHRTDCNSDFAACFADFDPVNYNDAYNKPGLSAPQITEVQNEVNCKYTIRQYHPPPSGDYFWASGGTCLRACMAGPGYALASFVAALHMNEAYPTIYRVNVSQVTVSNLCFEEV